MRAFKSEREEDDGRKVKRFERPTNCVLNGKCWPVPAGLINSRGGSKNVYPFARK